MDQVIEKLDKLEILTKQNLAEILEELKLIRKENRELRELLKSSERKTESIEIINYTDRSFVVVGDTKPYVEDFKALGGRWNSNLDVPGSKGWVFSTRRLMDVEKLLNNA